MRLYTWLNTETNELTKASTYDQALKAYPKDARHGLYVLVWFDLEGSIQLGSKH